MTVQLGAFINYAGDSVFPSAKRGYFFLSPGGHENSELNKSLVLYEHSLHCQQDRRVQLLLLRAPHSPHASVYEEAGAGGTAGTMGRESPLL